MSFFNNKRFVGLSLVWLIWKLVEQITVNRVDPTSTFVSSSSHYYYAVLYTVVIILLLVMAAFMKGTIKFYQLPLLAPQALLFLFALLSVLWSENMMVSMGQAIYSIYGMLMAIGIYSICSKGAGDKVNRIKLFIYLWIFLILIDFFVNYWGAVLVRQEKVLPAMDERALISICLILLLNTFNFRAFFSKTLMLFVYFFGQSFSALVFSLIPLSSYIGAKYGSLSRTLVIVFAISAVSLIFFLISLNYFTLYGKSINFFITGSGRFQVWEALATEIADRPLAYSIIGQGFMSERAYLSQLELPWTIDVHNNVLQTLYGLGSVGLLLLFNVWYQLHSTIKKLFFSGRIDKFLFKILVAFNLSFIAFGLTSSHYFSRPSITAIFFTSLILLLNEKEFIADACGRLKTSSKMVT